MEYITIFNKDTNDVVGVINTTTGDIMMHCDYDYDVLPCMPHLYREKDGSIKHFPSTVVTFEKGDE